jgi:hypothetical protein
MGALIHLKESQCSLNQVTITIDQESSETVRALRQQALPFGLVLATPDYTHRESKSDEERASRLNAWKSFDLECTEYKAPPAVKSRTQPRIIKHLVVRGTDSFAQDKRRNSPTDCAAVRSLGRWLSGFGISPDHSIFWKVHESESATRWKFDALGRICSIRQTSWTRVCRLVWGRAVV